MKIIFFFLLCFCSVCAAQQHKRQITRKFGETDTAFVKNEYNKLTNIINKYPDSSDLYLNRAFLLYEEYAWRIADTNYNNIAIFRNVEKAISLQPNNPKGYSERGFYKYWINKNKDEAIADKSLAISLDSLNPQWYKERAIFYKQISHYQKACADFTKCADMNDKECIDGKRDVCSVERH